MLFKVNKEAYVKGLDVKLVAYENHCIMRREF